MCDAVKPAEIALRVLGRERSGRDIQSLTNRLGDIAKGNAFLAHRVLRLAGCSLFKDADVKPGCIKPVDGWPAILTLAYIDRHAILSGMVDQI